ncbi:MAG: hypothetical protein ACF8NJ_07370 [Phycisphaerales bacterium JB038]
MIEYLSNVAAIDVGSNAMRMVIGAVDETSFLVEAYKRREPVRLGADVFAHGHLRKGTMRKALEAFQRFRELLEEYQVSHLRAVATSATREAANGEELIERVREATDIELEKISGLEEAHLVYVGVSRAVYLVDKNALIVDMGGGRVELTVVRQGVAVGCETLPIGPLRLLAALRRQDLKEGEAMQLLTRYRGVVADLLRAELGESPLDLCVGAGGNIERMGKMRAPLLGKIKTGKIKRRDLDVLLPTVLNMSVERRREELRLRADRADIIGIAMFIVRMILEEATAEKMLIPGVGLREGLLWQVTRQAVAPPWAKRTAVDMKGSGKGPWYRNES